jgi:hypothetical protein
MEGRFRTEGERRIRLAGRKDQVTKMNGSDGSERGMGLEGRENQVLERPGFV